MNFIESHDPISQLYVTNNIQNYTRFLFVSIIWLALNNLKATPDWFIIISRSVILYITKYLHQFDRNQWIYHNSQPINPINFSQSQHNQLGYGSSI